MKFAAFAWQVGHLAPGSLVQGFSANNWIKILSVLGPVNIIQYLRHYPLNFRKRMIMHCTWLRLKEVSKWQRNGYRLRHHSAQKHSFWNAQSCVSMSFILQTRKDFHSRWPRRRIERNSAGCVMIADGQITQVSIWHSPGILLVILNQVSLVLWSLLLSMLLCYLHNVLTLALLFAWPALTVEH